MKQRVLLACGFLIILVIVGGTFWRSAHKRSNFNSPVGAWKDSFDDAIFVFFENKTVFRTFLSLSDDQREHLDELHSLGKWVVLPDEIVEIRFFSGDPERVTSEGRYVFSPNSSDILLSEHGGYLKRVVAAETK